MRWFCIPTSFTCRGHLSLTAGDLPSWWHKGMGPSHGDLLSAGQHRPGKSSSAPLLSRAFQHRGIGLPLPSSRGCIFLVCRFLSDKYYTQTTPLLLGASWKEGAERRGLLCHALVLHNSTRGCCASGRSGKIMQLCLCELNDRPRFKTSPSHLFTVH